MTAAVPRDIDRGKRLALVVSLVLQLALTGLALWPAAGVLIHIWPGQKAAWQWTLLILGAAIVFTFVYLTALLVLRVLIPLPPEGYHELMPGGRPPWQAVVFMLNVVLAKMRYEPPWAKVLSAVLARVWPLGPLYRRYFGPHTVSMTLGDTFHCYDPWYLYAGRRVQFGVDCVIACHHFDNQRLYIRRVSIGDDAVIGGHAIIMAGAEIGHHAMVGGRSLVLPDTKIGPYELWSGSPARRVKTLAPATAPDAIPASGASPPQS